MKAEVAKDTKKIRQAIISVSYMCTLNSSAENNLVENVIISFFGVSSGNLNH